MAKRNIGAMLFNSKIVSVLLAVLLWVYVVGVRGPDTTKSIEAQLIAVNVPQGTSWQGHFRRLRLHCVVP